MLKNQLTHMQATGLPTSPEGLDALQVQEDSTYPVHPELDDEPIANNTQVIPFQFNTCPYSFTTTLPAFSTATYGLLLLASKQTKWTASLPNTFIPAIVIQNIRQAILQQVPTIIRSNVERTELSRDACNITNLAFNGLRPT
jgi:hypothetical protein